MSATDTPATTSAPKSQPFRPINRTSPHVVIIGGGFGGLQFARSLSNTNARITLVDRQNHHVFQPLLYQVATCALSPEDIAQPIRGLLSTSPNISVQQGEVKGIDLKARAVAVGDLTLEYDYLVIAMGGATIYFGKDHWEKFAPGLKNLNDALRIRQEIMSSLEKAEITDDETERKKLMTVVVVGGGPTGVEMAGSLRDMGQYILKNNFRRIKPEDIKVILIEALPKILGPFESQYISDNATFQLRQMGVDVRLNTMVSDIQQNKVILKDGSTIDCCCIVWSAGVGANPITKGLGVELDRGGRIKVNPDCSIPNFPEAFAIGDVANLTLPTGKFVPWVSPGAVQMGQHVAKIIKAEVTDTALPFENRPKFEYYDKGSMAIIGQLRAVVKWKFVRLPLPVVGIGRSVAWLGWLGVHLFYLEGFVTKMTVATKWAWTFLTQTRPARVTINAIPLPAPAPAPAK